MTRLKWGVLAAIGWAAIGAAQANEATRQFQPQDVFALRFATDPQAGSDLFAAEPAHVTVQPLGKRVGQQKFFAI